MDFLKEIVKEIGDDYTKLASDIDETETYVDYIRWSVEKTVNFELFS